jgi:hypothetical protein
LTLRGTGAFSSTGLGSIRINGVTTSSYGSHTVNGRGDQVRSAANSSWNAILNNVAIPLAQSTANAFSGTVIDVLDFQNAGGTKKPTIRTFSGVHIGDPYVILASGMLDSQTAVNSVTFFGWDLAAGSRLSLYGIR